MNGSFKPVWESWQLNVEEKKCCGMSTCSFLGKKFKFKNLSYVIMLVLHLHGNAALIYSL